MISTIAQLKELVGAEVFRITVTNISYNSEFTTNVLSIETIVDGVTHSLSIYQPQNSSWYNTEIESNQPYTVQVLRNPKYEIEQLHLHGKHRGDIQEIVTNQTDTVKSTVKQYATTATNVRDLPKDFIAEVEIVNLKVARKSMYLTMIGNDEMSGTFRVHVPNHIDAEAINNTTQHFIVQGVSSLQLAPIDHSEEILDEQLGLTEPKYTKPKPPELSVGTKFTNGSHIVDIGEVFGELVYQVWNSEIEPNTILNEMQIRFNYDIIVEPALEELLTERTKLRTVYESNFVEAMFSQELVGLDDKLVKILTDLYGLQSYEKTDEGSTLTLAELFKKVHW